MYFTAKLAGILLAAAASARSAAVARTELDALSVIFFDDVNFTGSSYSPYPLLQSVCSTLPGLWLDRAESVTITPGLSCTFFIFQDCEGPGITFSGNIAVLPGSFFNGIETFSCN